MKTYQSFSSRETKKIAATIAKKLVLLARRSGAKAGSQPKEILHSKPDRTARVVALSGDLGSGKTTFAQGFLRALGVRGRITSPTFIILKRFTIHGSRFTHAYHADFYRLQSAAHLKPLEFKKILSDPKNIILIEWPEKVKSAIPKNAVKILFRHGENERIIITKNL